ncbi:MAG: PKD domain-containing protein [Candidatus Thermoplasmatota archaeon]|nr:PKD domain-containing protein [Candidatus Thermoplasmatota archaeon]
MKEIRQMFGIIICLLVVGAGYYGVTASASYTGIVKGIHNMNYNIAPSSLITDKGKYWAILVCGSDDFSAGFETDIRDMYQLLKNELDYNGDHIYYVAPSNWNGAEHYYSLSKDNINKSIHDVAGRATTEDSVFLFYTAHGNYNKNTGEYSIAPGVTPGELDSWLDSIDPIWLYGQPRKCQQMVILLQACYSGGFKEKLVFHEAYPTGAAHRHRILITSTDKYTKSWEDMYGYGDPTKGATWDPNAPDDDGNPNNPSNGNYDGSEFSSGFRMAFRDVDNDAYLEADDQPYINKPGNKPDLTPPFGNKDGKVSVQEAFNFSKFEDCYSVYWESFIKAKNWKLEYPQIWDALSWGDSEGIDPSKTYIYNRRPNMPDKPSGPISGNAGTSYSYSTSATDPDNDKVKYYFDWGDGTGDWTAFVFSGNSASKSHSWSSAGTYQVKAKATDERGAESGWSSTLTVTISAANQPPNKPDRPSGPTSGRVGTSYTYSSSTIDPDGDQIYYWFDWGDGINSGWLGPYDSGQSVNASHTWSEKGTYGIKVKAKDVNGVESEWSDSLAVSMPKSYPVIWAIFEKINSLLLQVFGREIIPLFFNI